MALITLGKINGVARARTGIRVQEIHGYRTGGLNEVNEALQEDFLVSMPSRGHFDVFLSHSYDQKNTALRLKAFLEEEYGLNVYIDWIVDKELSRNLVTPKTAARLKQRMNQSMVLLYLHMVSSPHKPPSVWMPWELGYFDGAKGRIAVLPVTRSDDIRTSFKGKEYLGLYPYVDEVDGTLYVNFANRPPLDFERWIDFDVAKAKQILLESQRRS